MHHGIGELIDVPMERGRVVAPETLHRRDSFVGHPAPLREIGSQEGEFFREPADAESEQETFTGQHVQGGGLLGHQDGIALGQDEGGRAHLQVGGQVHHRGQGDEGLDDVPHAAPRCRGDHMVVCPNRRITQGLGCPGRLLDGFPFAGRAVIFPIRGEECADTHAAPSTAAPPNAWGRPLCP